MNATEEIQRRIKSTENLIEQHKRMLCSEYPQSALANIRSLKKLLNNLKEELMATHELEKTKEAI